MNILVIGGGGREHTLCWKLAQSPQVEKIYCAPGNAGTAGVAENLPVKADDLDGLLAAAKEKSVDLTVVGPEAPLVAGIVDLFQSAGLAVFGPVAAAAHLEGSKAFAKEIMAKSGVPTGQAEIFSDYQQALANLRQRGGPIVIKADGLAAGKGVYVCKTLEEAEQALKLMMVDGIYGDAGKTVLLEEMLEGEECSILALVDGKDYLLLPSSQDHKRIGEGDTGPNTGGMGAYSPAPVVTPEMEEKIAREILAPTVRTLAESGSPYKGILYLGLMVTAQGPKVVEYNVRLGDPETQAVLPRVASDLVPLFLACCAGKLAGMKIEVKNESAVCIVAAAEGYPGSYQKGQVISGLEGIKEEANTVVFHAGTAQRGGELVTAGGRVLGLTALGAGIKETQKMAYEALQQVNFDGMYYRKDIGYRAIDRQL